MVLADLGADVVKIERPGEGDETRAWGPPYAGGEAAYYLSVNRSKRSLAVDLKAEDGRELVLALCARADVVIENFRAGVAQRLGVDPGHLHFHVRMLLKAGLIELAENGSGREKPYRAVARTFRVAPELLASGGARDIQAAMIDQVQRAHALYSDEGNFRGAQLELRLSLERALELMTEFLNAARDIEDEHADKIVLTMFAHLPASQD